MVTKDRVSFETAKLLKEKGFDDPCYAYWDEDENKLIISQSPYAIQNITNPCFFGPAAPTLQTATKWLRENHNLYVTLVPNGIGEKIFYPCIYKKFEWGWTVLESSLNGFQNTEFISPEEAIDEGIKYCLENLI